MPDTDPTVAASPGAEREQWLHVLDGLEVELAADRAVLLQRSAEVSPKSWMPPQLGPLPDDLRARAERVLSALEETRALLLALSETTGKQLTALRSVPPAGRTDQAVYLDVAG